MPSPPLKIPRRWPFVVACLSAIACVALPWSEADAAQWYKGNLHTHSTWSTDVTDTTATPGNVATWYKNHGYNFLALTDHNVLKSTLMPALESAVNVPGQFMMVWGEEITSYQSGKSVHVNGLNVAAQIAAYNSSNVLAMLQTDVGNVKAQGIAYGKPMIATINHPNYRFTVTPEDVAQTTDTRFLEVLNAGSATVYHYGDATHIGTEKIWDVANTIRMVNMGMLPLYGTGTDDSHTYATIGPDKSNPGRGWCMVRAEELTLNALVNAMNNGQFYFSNGVELPTVEFNGSTGTLSVAIAPESGANYWIDFIGTPKGTDPTKRLDGTYSPDVGKVLATVAGTSASYTLTGEELYVRAHIRSNKPAVNPATGNVQFKEAWTQPVGEWLMVPGDANGDTVVDDNDAAIMAAHWLWTGNVGWSDGDFNSDGHVDDRDAAILAAHWQRSGNGESVPEPGACTLLGGLAVVWFAQRGKWWGRLRDVKGQRSRHPGSADGMRNRRAVNAAECQD